MSLKRCCTRIAFAVGLFLAVLGVAAVIEVTIAGLEHMSADAKNGESCPRASADTCIYYEGDGTYMGEVKANWPFFQWAFLAAASVLTAYIGFALIQYRLESR